LSNTLFFVQDQFGEYKIPEYLGVVFDKETKLWTTTTTAPLGAVRSENKWDVSACPLHVAAHNVAFLIKDAEVYYIEEDREIME
jgi:hypothetical protein